VNAFFPSLGNHDWYTSGAAPYLSYFALPGNERYYDFVRGPVHFFAIDSDGHEPDGNTATSKQGTMAEGEAGRLRPRRSTSSTFTIRRSPAGGGSSAFMDWPFKAWGAISCWRGTVTYMSGL